MKIELEEGARQQVRVEASSKATQAVDGKERDVSPAGSESTLDATVSEVVPMGAFVVIGLKPSARSAANPAVATALAESVMRVLVTPDGTIKQAGAKGPVLNNPLALKVLRDASSSLVANALPLPTQPIGKGAKWRVTAPQPGPLLVEQQADIELLERTERSVKVKISGKLVANPQPIHLPGTPLFLERLAGTVEGERVIPLDRPLFAGKVTADSTQFAVATRGGEKRKVVTHTTAIRTYTELEGAAPVPSPSSSAAATVGTEN